MRRCNERIRYIERIGKRWRRWINMNGGWIFESKFGLEIRWESWGFIMWSECRIDNDMKMI